METIKKIAMLTTVGCLLLGRSYAQSAEVEQLLLNAEKLTQLKNILSDMKKGYQVVSKGYNAVKDISQGNFNLHEAFLSGLMKASPSVRKYQRVADIISLQQQILSEYKSAYNKFRSSGSFDVTELDYLGRVYGKLNKESLQNLDELATVVTSSDLRMSDEERLASIDRIFASMEDKMSFLRDFNRKNTVLVIQRMKANKDVSDVQGLYK